MVFPSLIVTRVSCGLNFYSMWSVKLICNIHTAGFSIMKKRAYGAMDTEFALLNLNDSVTYYGQFPFICLTLWHTVHFHTKGFPIKMLSSLQIFCSVVKRGFYLFIYFWLCMLFNKKSIPLLALSPISKEIRFHRRLGTSQI